VHAPLSFVRGHLCINVLNRTNFTNYYGTLRSTRFGQPTQRWRAASFNFPSAIAFSFGETTIVTSLRKDRAG
jgi:hypothetical protein